MVSTKILSRGMSADQLRYQANRIMTFAGVRYQVGDLINQEDVIANSNAIRSLERTNGIVKLLPPAMTRDEEALVKAARDEEAKIATMPKGSPKSINADAETIARKPKALPKSGKPRRAPVRDLAQQDTAAPPAVIIDPDPALKNNPTERTGETPETIAVRPEGTATSKPADTGPEDDATADEIEAEEIERRLGVYNEARAAGLNEEAALALAYGDPADEAARAESSSSSSSDGDDQPKTEAEKTAIYEAALKDGLSDYEARDLAWGREE